MSVPPLVPPILIDQMEASRDWSEGTNPQKREIAFRAGWDAAFKLMEGCNASFMPPGASENPIVHDVQSLKKYKVHLYFVRCNEHHYVYIHARTFADALAAAYQNWGGPQGAHIGNIECQ